MARIKLQPLPKTCRIGTDVRIAPTARIQVSEKLVLGDRTVVGAHVFIEGRSIEIGREGWIDEYAHIGGGSCFDRESSLVAGDFLHMGKFSHINTARPVTIGDEVGIGIGTKIFTHGAYLPFTEGFPVSFAPVHIGNRVWIPNAWVNPGVTIGDNVVVAAMSLVNKDIPGGALAGGIPCRVLKAGIYPRVATSRENRQLMSSINESLDTNYTMVDRTITVETDHGATVFDLARRSIMGNANPETERLKNQLRRMGIRFRYKTVRRHYEQW
jgi:acetyltransferase-like isoleucine patch superfamily enzyme